MIGLIPTGLNASLHPWVSGETYRINPTTNHSIPFVNTAKDHKVKNTPRVPASNFTNALDALGLTAHLITHATDATEITQYLNATKTELNPLNQTHNNQAKQTNKTDQYTASQLYPH